MVFSRIVSLVPNLTELLFALGAGDRVVGRTRFCTEPAAARTVPSIGGTKDPKIERVLALSPDLVIANQEENRREDVEALRGAGLNVVVTNPATVGEATASIIQIGELVGRAVVAAELAASIDRAAERERPQPALPFAVVLWKDPLMVLGGATFGNDLLGHCGGRNVFADLPRYPAISIEQLIEREPAVILLPDEPYPFKAADVALFAAIAPAELVDGKLLWWYGPRTPGAIDSLRERFQAAVGQ